MTRLNQRGRDPLPAHRKAALTALVLLTCTLGLTGCGRIVNAVANHVTHGKLDQDETAVDGFTTKIKAGESRTFVVTYQTTGTSPATIKVAATPPKDFAFVDTTSSGTVAADLLQNSSGSDFCSQSSSSGSSSHNKLGCLKLTKNTKNTYNALKLLYTGQYWIDFLNVYRYAGVAGVSVKSSTMTVNGFSLQCITAIGSAGSTTTTGSAAQQSSTVCVTSQGILGYVKVSTDSTAFEIKSYSASPPASLFQVPAGATITTLPPSPPSTT